jgi:hypothetical protein
MVGERDERRFREGGDDTFVHDTVLDQKHLSMIHFLLRDKVWGGETFVHDNVLDQRHLSMIHILRRDMCQDGGAGRKARAETSV